MALDGNLAAIREIGDRIEGKPAQTTINIEEGNRQDLEDYSIDELKKLLSDLSREDSNGNEKGTQGIKRL